MQSHPAIGFSQYRIIDQCLDHGGLQVIWFDPLGNTAKMLERMAMQPDPRGDLLIKDQLRILVATVALGSHKHVGCSQAATDRVKQLAHAAKVNLHFLSGFSVYPDHSPLAHIHRSQSMHKPPHG